PGISAACFTSASRGPMKLTAKTVSALRLPAPSVDKIYFDDAMPGFGFRLRRSGDTVLRSWIVQYRRAGGTRRVTLGNATVLGAEQARLAAKKILAAAALGQDPQADRHKDPHSLRSVISEYLQFKATDGRPKTLREITRYLTGDYFKPLQAMPIDSIS